MIIPFFDQKAHSFSSSFCLCIPLFLFKLFDDVKNCGYRCLRVDTY
jgi:hypothetical protein